MPGPAPLRPLRIEQVVGYLRVLGLLAGVPTILLASFPGTARPQLAWGIQCVLLVGTVALVVWRRNLRPGDETAVLIGGFVLDALVITGYVLAFTHLRPNVAWAMVFTLLADAALRFGVRGAVLGWLLSVLLFVAQAQAHEVVTGVHTPLVSYLYVTVTLAGAGGILAVFTATLERQARTAQQQALVLAETDRVRERLLAMSSHEFRGSLTAMTLAADTVRTHLARLTPERAAALLEEVDRHGRQLGRLVDDLFAVARAQGEDVHLHPRWDDLPSTVRLALDAADRHRDRHEVSVSVEPVTCDLDHERLQQVLRNLVENAYKYSPPGSRVLVIAAHRGGAIEVRVGDEGPGIPAAEQERVLEPFARSGSAAPREDSAGLGLYVVQQVVTAMGGSLSLHSTPAGTEFVVSVPARTSGRARTLPPEGRPGTTERIAGGAAGGRVP
jgi:signal transduction histidine kinase